jgi:uncharacterized protein (TIGR00297 family)
MNFSFSLSFSIVIALLIIGGIVSYASKKLTLAASITGVLIGMLIYIGAGFPGIVMLAAFFVLGTAVTSYKKNEKLEMRVVEAHEGRRKASQVIANAGIAAILALLNTLIEPDSPALLVMIAASFASATGDTFSSELGNVYGRNFYNILTFKKDERGLNGVVSLEGTLAGIIGSVIIAFIYIFFFGWSFTFFVILVAGVAGNLVDSLLGALFERKGWLGNDAVNFLNTTAAALIAFFLLKS